MESFLPHELVFFPWLLPIFHLWVTAEACLQYFSPIFSTNLFFNIFNQKNAISCCKMSLFLFCRIKMWYDIVVIYFGRPAQLRRVEIASKSYLLRRLFRISLCLTWISGTESKHLKVSIVTTSSTTIKANLIEANLCPKALDFLV